MAGEIQLGGVTLATESGGVVSLDADVVLPYASQSEVFGTHTTFSGSHSDTATTINLASVSGISAGDYVVGEGIAPGTTVSSVGASSVVISTGLDTDGVGIAGGEPISFYKANKALSPGLVAGALCRAWVNFYGGSSTLYIRASYNVSSITDGGQGIYTLNFITAMPDQKYAVTGWAGSSGSTSNSVFNVKGGGTNMMQTGSVQIRTIANDAITSSLADLSEICISIFR